VVGADPGPSVRAGAGAAPSVKIGGSTEGGGRYNPSGSLKPPRRTPRAETHVAAKQPLTAEQAATLERLAQAIGRRSAFNPNLTRAQARRRIARLSATLKRRSEAALELGLEETFPASDVVAVTEPRRR